LSIRQRVLLGTPNIRRILLLSPADPPSATAVLKTFRKPTLVSGPSIDVINEVIDRQVIAFLLDDHSVAPPDDIRRLFANEIDGYLVTAVRQYFRQPKRE
jgi:hypothetical protein